MLYDQSIYSFWKTILDQPEEFCYWIKNVNIDIKQWHYFKELQSNSKYIEEFELAKSTFFLNRTNISGVIKGGVLEVENKKENIK